MMWLFVFAWVLLVAAAALFAQQALGFHLDETPALFLAQPRPQQVTIGIVVLAGLFLVVSSVWQSGRLAQRNRTVRNLQASLSGVRDATAAVDEAQQDFDAAAGHLDNSDPEQAIAAIRKRLALSEQRTTAQQGLNESVDLQERLEEIRLRQQALRKRIGEVSDKRREIEPVFGELRKRQAQLEQSLAEVETDENNNSLAGRLKTVSRDVAQIQARMRTLEDSLETMNRFKDELGRSQTQLVRLQAPDAGLTALLDELHARRDQLTRTLDELETRGDDKLSARVDALARNKAETEQRLASLDNCFAILNTIQREFGELEERRTHLQRALAEVETDPSGRSLADRQTALNEFAADTRTRVRVLQDSATALNGFRQEVDKSQAALVPLQAPADGIEALIGDLYVRRDRLLKTLDEIESHGDEKLSARVEALYRSKLETEQRIARISEHFGKLDSIRKEVDGLFAKLGGTIASLR